MPDVRDAARVYIVIGLTNVERFLLCRCPQTMTNRAGSADFEAANQLLRHELTPGSVSMSRHPKKDSGQDLVEYAVVFPVLILMLLGVFEFGRIIYAYNAISNLAREGTRYAVVPARRDDVQDITEDCPGNNPIVQDVCSRALALPGTLSVAISQEGAAGQPDPDVVHVEVAYNGAFLMNVIRDMVSPYGGPLILRAAATMRLE